MDKDEYRKEVLKELREHNEKLERIEESNAAIAIFAFCSTMFFFVKEQMMPVVIQEVATKA